MRKNKTLLVILLAVVTSLVLIFFMIRNENNNKQNNSPKTTDPTTQDTGKAVTQAATEPPTQTTESAEQPDVNDPAHPTTSPSASEPDEVKEPVDYTIIRPNESGEIPIVMFHNFVEDLNKTSDTEYTTSFDAFEELLETLYNNDFRLISMQNFIDHSISVPEGKIPMVFTFDDGTPGQFSLIRVNGKLEVNPKSAAGVMLKFHDKHPDFGLKGIFYINMSKGDKTFEGEGTLKERLDILTSYGFEVGNHTWSHQSLSTLKSKAEIIESLGKNEKALQELMGGQLSFYSLALPHGGKNESFVEDVVSGEFEGVRYNNKTIMAVGSVPSVPSIHKDYNPTYVARIRSQGKEEVKFDLTYWLPLMTRSRMYISDGDPDTVVIPESKSDLINKDMLGDKKLITY